jgi:putative membrane protein
MTKEPGRNAPRKPAAFPLDDAPAPPPGRPPTSFEPHVTMIEDKDDPFIGQIPQDELDLPPAVPGKGGFSWGGLALSALALIASLSLGLWIDGLITDLFSRSDWLGYLAMAATILFIVAVVVIAAREIFAMRRLAAAQALRKDAEDARHDPRPAPARAAISKLVELTRSRPETARGRAVLAETEGEIIDGPGLMRLAESELLAPLDAKARALVMASSKRVSIVTAVSPRALVDLVYVLFEATRLVRAIAETYGTRPGRLGFLRLFRDVLAHLAVTGSIAVGDSLVQQFIGHGLASKLSARLGEGVINGLMTARIGIAAMDLCRPMTFAAVKRPGIGDFLSDIVSTTRPGS